MSKIARILGTVALAAAPVIGFATPAHAVAGCSVDNTNSSVTIKVEVIVPPGSVTIDWSNESCSYVSNGGGFTATCTLIAGKCSVYKNGTEVFRCITANSTCVNNGLVAAPGDVIKLVVDGGSGSVHDNA